MTPRLDRLVSLYLLAPILRFVSGIRTTIPILMYHSIAEEDETGVHPYYRIATSPKTFKKQMEFLHELGYTTCIPAQVPALLASDRISFEKRVAITFDDGFQSVYREAFPALQRYGFSATVFLPTAHIGDSSLKFKGRDCLTWQEIRELQKYGIAFGSHTVSHPQLRNLNRDRIQLELTESKSVIEEKTSIAVDSFAYPYAFPQSDYPFRVILHDLLQSAGYSNGVCTIVGRAETRSDPFFLPRLPMNGDDDLDLLRAKLIGAYSWVGLSQSIIKRLKSGRMQLPKNPM